MKGTKEVVCKHAFGRKRSLDINLIKWVDSFGSLVFRNPFSASLQTLPCEAWLATNVGWVANLSWSQVWPLNMNHLGRKAYAWLSVWNLVLTQCKFVVKRIEVWFFKIKMFTAWFHEARPVTDANAVSEVPKLRSKLSGYCWTGKTSCQALS